MNDWNWRAPITLTRHEPIAQAIADRALACFFLFENGDKRSLRRLVRHAIVRATIHKTATFFIRGGHRGRIEFLPFGLDHDFDFKPIFTGEFEIALIVRRNRHDCASAVIHQDKVRDVDRHFVARRGIHAVTPREEAFFFHVGAGELRAVLVAKAFDECVRFSFIRRALNELRRKRMFSRNRHERHTEKRVRARRENSDVIGAIDWLLQREINLRAEALADPILLHREHLLRPLAFKLTMALQQFFRVLCRAQEPLRHLFLNDDIAAAPALAIFHLLIRKHGAAVLAPVRKRKLPIREALFEHAQKHGLFVLVIGRIAGREFARPVVAEAKFFELHTHLRDIFVSPFFRMALTFNRSIFRRHAERIPTHRMQNRFAAHAKVAREYIAERVVANVAHVNAPRRIRQHLEEIKRVVVCGVANSECI